MTNPEAPRWSGLEVITQLITGGRGKRYSKPPPRLQQISVWTHWEWWKEEKYPSFCSFCLLWQNRTLIYRHCKLCRSTLFLNFHWWRNCFTAPSSFSTATITTDVNTLVNDWSSYRRTRGPKTQKEAIVRGHFFRWAAFLKHDSSEHFSGCCLTFLENTKGLQSIKETRRMNYEILSEHLHYLYMMSSFYTQRLFRRKEVWNVNLLGTIKVFTLLEQFTVAEASRPSAWSRSGCATTTEWQQLKYLTRD